MAKSAEKRGVAPEEQGFSIVELVVSLALLAIIFGAALPAMYSALNLGRNNRNRSIAANLAAQQIDVARDAASSLAGFQTLSNGKITTTQAVGGITYTVNEYRQWVTPGTTTSSCNGSSTASAQFLRLSVEVSWPNMAGTPTVKNQTIVAPPVGTYDPYTGAIGVKIVDHANLPLPDVTVTVTAPGGGPATPPIPSQVSSFEGCAYFAFVPATGYLVTITRTGYVGDSPPGATPSVTTTVSAGVTNQLVFAYDAAASLAPTFTGGSGGTVPLLMPVTVANSGLSGGKSLLSAPWGSLFPYSSGYSVWAGDCGDAAPTTRPGAVNVTAGGPATPVALTLQSVDVTVKHGTTPIQGETITVIHAADALSCTVGDSYNLDPTLKTDVNGVLRVALPLGTWTFGATGSTYSGSGGSVTLTPTTVGVPVAALSV